MKDKFSLSSRYERTQKSKKQTLILNVLIGVVFIGILAVGASILLGDDEPASQKQPNEDNTASAPDKNEDSDKSNNESSSEKENEKKEKDKDKTSVKEDESSEKEEESSESENEGSGDYKTASDETAGPDGEWEPVGTVQKEHQNSFDKGTVDWQEKQKALQYATGLSADEITYWWIGNGGSSNTVKGVVSKAENEDNPYVVMLEWVDGQGWKPTSVERVPGAANQ